MILPYSTVAFVHAFESFWVVFALYWSLRPFESRRIETSLGLATMFLLDHVQKRYIIEATVVNRISLQNIGKSKAKVVFTPLAV
jgi:hypothetical protein